MNFGALSIQDGQVLVTPFCPPVSPAKIRAHGLLDRGGGSAFQHRKPQYTQCKELAACLN